MSVSNLKSKYVAYLPVLSQISNCQGLGRKNKFEILKTDRILQFFLFRGLLIIIIKITILITIVIIIIILIILIITSAC